MVKLGTFDYQTDPELKPIGMRAFRHFYNYKSNAVTVKEVKVAAANENWCKYVEKDDPKNRFHTASIENFTSGNLVFSGTGVTAYSQRNDPDYFLSLLEDHYRKKAEELLEDLDRTADRLENVRSMIKEAR